MPTAADKIKMAIKTLRAELYSSLKSGEEMSINININSKKAARVMIMPSIKLDPSITKLRRSKYRR